jgi:hypothetical protein
MADTTSPQGPAVRESAVVAIPAARPLSNRGAGSTAAPFRSVTLDVKGDFEDDVAWRRFVGVQLATQTLSQQRTEWYARSIRVYVMVLFWLSVVGGVLAAIILLATGDDTSSSTGFYG